MTHHDNLHEENKMLYKRYDASLNEVDHATSKLRALMQANESLRCKINKLQKELQEVPQTKHKGSQCEERNKCASE